MDSDDVRRAWADRDGEYSPAYYAHYGADETSESIRDLLETYAARDASVLELGCSSGRHLAHLLEHGYENLSGIELNAEAFDVMAEHYPELWDAGTFYADAIENVVGDFADGEFDAVYSVETLQHVHPDAEWVFAEVARVTRDLLVTVETESEAAEAAERIENEDDPDVNYVRDDVPLFYRDWGEVFTDLGFEQVARREGKRETIRAFRAR
ncbi:MAG: class I SAM-dependent methyltransferase [Halosimplex sp.]